jgi:hypothetical protein
MVWEQERGVMPALVGEPRPANCELIEVRVPELTRLFHAMDPSAFRERDLDPGAEAFIAEWAREVPPSSSLGLIVYVERPAGRPGEQSELCEAIHDFFRRRAELSRRQLRDLFGRGRLSLAIGVCALGISMAAGDLARRAFTHHATDLLAEGLLIGGWVAMWRPIEIFLYDWWPIRADATLADRLSAMPVRITYIAGDSA